ncbi:MAG: Glycogen synthase [Parcubacteria group bacterium GW2011_GWB1_56_8]|nr:MAG: Glycogen synthase [Parcubacteria group bacterium GW2011_GWB1_56_8]
MKLPLAEKPLKVLFVGAEASPFVKVGGLGEVLRALPKAMRELGCDARMFMPKYGSMDAEKFPMKLEMGRLRVVPKEEDPHDLLILNILVHTDSDKGVTYFLENMECFEKRANVYGYADDTMRWVLLSRSAIEFAKRSKWKPDFIIANDWETGFIPNLLRTEYAEDKTLAGIGAVFCIHNLRNQGTFDAAFVSEVDADFGRKPIPPFFADMKYLNGMRRGILYADQIVTVSPTYAQEIVSKEYGEGLDGILQERRGDLVGILNGIDAERFDPATDTVIAARYSVHHLNARQKNKTALQRQFGLKEDEHIMILGMNCRLDEQKGLSLIEPIMKHLLDNLLFQFVLVGDGSSKYKKFFKELSGAYPSRVGVHLEYDEKLPRMIYAGADAVLVPSRFEPAGLVQLEAIRYGCIPIVRKTGGLADTVEDFDPHGGKGTGFVFEPFDPQALLITVVRAYESYRNKREWMRLVERAMSQDFSWKNSARKYMALCRKSKRNAAPKPPGS